MKRSKELNYDDELNIFIQDAKELFGYDEATLLAEMEAAERDWEREQQENPEEATRIMQENDSKFEELMRKIEAEGIRPASEKYADVEHAEIEMEEDDEYETLDDVELAEVNANDTGNAEEYAVESDGRYPVTAAPEMAPAVAVGTVESANGRFEDKHESAEIRSFRLANSGKKAGGWRKRKKMLLMVAAVAVLGLGTTMMVQGRREYKLEQYPMEAEKNIILNHNSAFKLSHISKVEDAYKEIEAILEIEALKLNDIPLEMEFKQLVIENNRAVIEFVYEGKSVYLKEMKYPQSSELTNIIASDRLENETIYNIWLDKEITLEENLLDNGLIEYSAGVEYKDSYYYLSGIMRKELFIGLMEGISE